MADPLTFLCIASYYKGNRFLERLHAEGVKTYLLTVESLLGEPWPRAALADVVAVNNFTDRKALEGAVSYFLRSHPIDRIVALDDFDIEVAAALREHFRMTDTGHGDSAARFFRDKLAMRKKAVEIGVKVPEFAGLFHDRDVNDFLKTVPGPWLIKPRSEASAAGIRVLRTADEAWKRVHELGDGRSFALIERMVPGDLFHVDSLVYQGKVVFAEANAYHKPLLDVYQGGGVYASRTFPRGHPDAARLKAVNAKVLEGFGLGDGASHTEFMKSHADGEFYFIETSARVGGANTAEMVEAATGVNLWSEWAKLEICRTTGGYAVPKLKQRYGGVTVSLARQEKPDTSAFQHPEIVYRLDMKNHIGFVLAADTPEKVQAVLSDVMGRIARDHSAVLPPADKVSH